MNVNKLHFLPGNNLSIILSTSCFLVKKLVDYPFAPLVESYEKCHNSPSVVFLNQFGITMGNVSVLLPFCAMAILILFRSILRLCKMDTSDDLNYTTIEVDRASRSLAIALLLKRDKKVNIGDILEKDPEIVNDPKISSILDQLVSELTSIAQMQSKSNEKKSTLSATVEMGDVKSSLHHDN